LADYLLIPALVYAFVSGWLHGAIPSVPAFFWVLVFMLFNTVVNVRGIQLAARINFILLGIEFVALLAFVVAAIKYVFIDGKGAGGFTLAPLFLPGHIDLNFIAAAASIASLSFLGFDAISTLAEETKNPERTVGRATVASLIILGLIYMLQTYLAALVHPGYKDLDPSMGFFNIAKEAGGSFLYYLLIIVKVVGAGLATGLTAQSAVARVLYSMSRDKFLPFSGFLGKIHPKYRTPSNTTLFVGVLSIIVAVSVPLETLIKFVNFGALTSFMLLNLTVFIHFFVKKRERGWKGFFKYLLLPLIGFGVIAYIWSGFDKMTFIFGTGWLMIGIILGAVKTKGYKNIPKVLDL
jgi:amino acid transporter